MSGIISKINLPFLKSERFWQVFIVVIFQLLAAYSVVPQEVANAISVWLGASVTIRTVDRFSEKVGSPKV